MVGSPPAAVEINGGKREAMEDNSTQGNSTNIKGKDEQINNTTLQLTGTFHQEPQSTLQIILIFLSQRGREINGKPKGHRGSV